MVNQPLLTIPKLLLQFRQLCVTELHGFQVLDRKVLEVQLNFLFQGIGCVLLWKINRGIWDQVLGFKRDFV